ncbi:MAG: 4-hydroxybenzoate octaprenyltransferase [Betaproteobacteria bacterium]|nr:4-hydroxybenzoate octaprenyltransferase [Betaproteobacteria bacterium]
MTWARLEQRINAYERLLRLDKPIGTLLLLWPTLWAVWLASRGMPGVEIVAIFCVGTLLMRSAGCAVNDFFDRGFDRHVERTRDRPLATGEIRPAEALVLAALLAAAAFGLVLMLNRLALQLSFVALGIAVTYPLTKRVFALPQLYLGVAFGFGIPMAYAAIQNRLPLECWVLLAANVCYAFAYDTEYAMVDRDDDARIGMRTSARTLGRYDVAGVMAAYTGMLALLAWVGILARLGWMYYAGLVIAAVLMAAHYRLIRDRSREGCFRAFRGNNWVGAAVFAGIAAHYGLR